MKFFNWVHKRFHHPIPKGHDFVDDHNTTKAENCNARSDEELVKTQSLLKKAVLVDALDGWKDGILAIGTFGFDPLKPFSNPRDYLILDSEQDDTPEFSSDDDTSDNDSDTTKSEDEEEEEEEANPLMLSEEIMDHMDDNKKPGRTTLADLFLAEADQLHNVHSNNNKKKRMMMMTMLGSVKLLSDHDNDFAYVDVHDDDDDYRNHPKKQNLKKKLSFARKLIPKVKDESSPIKNIQRLMRRMLKRKIHPELLDVKSQKSDGQMAAGVIELVTNVAALKSASESVSLLAMQGVPSKV